MYFPKKRVSLNIAETSYVMNAIYELIHQDNKNYQISSNYHQSLLDLFNGCKYLWSDHEWEVYKYVVTFEKSQRGWEIDRDAEWEINILDCDSIIFTLQHTFMRASKDFINGDKDCKRLMEVMSEILIPRFTNTFNDDEWKYYFSLIEDNDSDDEVSQPLDIHNQDTQEVR